MLGCCLQRLLLHFHIYKIIESGYCQINNARQTKKATERTANMATVTQDSYVYQCVRYVRVCVYVCAERQEHIPCVHKLALLFCAGLALLLAPDFVLRDSGLNPPPPPPPPLAI